LLWACWCGRWVGRVLEGLVFFEVDAWARRERVEVAPAAGVGLDPLLVPAQGPDPVGVGLAGWATAVQR
jgi:hypothetical protein